MIHLLIIFLFHGDSLYTREVRDTVVQKDLVDLIGNIITIPEKVDKKRENKKVYFSIVPGTSSVPGGGVAVVTAFNSAFYTGPRENTNLSNLLITPYLTFNQQYVLPLKANIWTPRNIFNIMGDIRFMKFPQYNWGLGPETPGEDKTLIDYFYFRNYITVLKKIRGRWNAGFGYFLDLHYNISEEEIISVSHLNSYPYGTAGRSVSSGLTLSLQYDKRINPINPRPGSYGIITFRTNEEFLGSDYNWTSLYIDLRKYFSLSRRSTNNILAFRTYYWTTLALEVPYLDLPAIGWEPLARGGRGYQLDRHRSNAILYGEGEWRFNLTRNGLFGMVIFANVHSVSELNTQNFQYGYPGAGTGLRIKFNKFSGTNIGLDWGISKEFQTIYVWLGEVF